MALLSALLTGRSGLRSAGYGLKATSDNVANSLTPGYSRRSVEQTLRSPIMREGLMLGQGSQVDALVRSADRVLNQRRLTESGVYASTIATESALSLVESYFDESTDIGLRNRFDRVFDTMTELTRDPASTTLRTQVVDSMVNFADTIGRTATTLRTAQGGFATNMDAALPEANAALRDVAQLNRAIMGAGGEHNAPDLADQRDVILRQLAEDVGARTQFGSDGHATVFIGGHAVVSGVEARTLSADVTGPIPQIRVNTGPGGTLDITRDIGGTVGGYVQAWESTNAYVENLNTFASEFATAMNAQHAGGFDAHGNPGQALFTFVPDEAAASFEVNAALRGDGSLMALAGDPAAEAGDIDNLILLEAIQQERLLPGNREPGAFLSAISASIGTEVANTRSLLEQQGAIVSDLDMLADRVHGVNLDDEATNLMTYQTAYQAAAKVIQTADAMISVLLDLK